MESTMLNNRAYQKPSTVKPVINDEASKMIMAFITSRKSPRVRIVNGIVRMIRIGFTRTFNREMIKAAKMAVVNESTATPGKI